MNLDPGDLGLPACHGGELAQDLDADRSALGNQFFGVVGAWIILDDGVHKDVRVEERLGAHRSSLIVLASSFMRFFAVEDESGRERTPELAQSLQGAFPAFVAADFQLAAARDTNLDVVAC